MEALRGFVVGGLMKGWWRMKMKSCWLAVVMALTVAFNGLWGAEKPDAGEKAPKYAAADYNLVKKYGWPDAIVGIDQNQNRLEILRADKPWNDPASLLWCWNSSTAKELSENEKKTFGNISDAKPVLGGTHLLTCASGGAVALINIKECRAEFIGYAGGNTHSIELLPDGNIVAASSNGNFLSLLVRDGGKRAPKKVLKVPLEDAHGCVWDKQRNILWACGMKEIAAYEYDAEKWELRKLFACAPDYEIFSANSQLPPVKGKFGGHDLFPVAGEDKLFLTNWYNVLTFDPRTREFALYHEQPRIKSISRNPESGEVIMQVPVTKWWTESITTQAPQAGRLRTLPGAKFYKARWFTANLFSYGLIK